MSSGDIFEKSGIWFSDKVQTQKGKMIQNDDDSVYGDLGSYLNQNNLWTKTPLQKINEDSNNKNKDREDEYKNGVLSTQARFIKLS